MFTSKIVPSTASRPSNATAKIAATLLGLTVVLGGIAARPSDADRLWIAEVDLGADVTRIPKTDAAVRAFLASLDTKGQRTIVNACQHYVADPGAIIGPDTLPFCSVAVGGQGELRPSSRAEFQE